MKEPTSMDECSFFTRRILDDGTKVVAWVPVGQKFVNIIYDCAKCKYHGELTQEFVKPITFNCQKCGTKIIVEPLKKGVPWKKIN